MQKLVWKNTLGDKVDLTSGNYGITEWEGFSNAPLNIQSQQVPFQDGAVFLDALMEQRELSVTLKMQDNNNLENRYRMRRELIHILNPKLGEGYLIYTNDFTSKRIKCVPQIPLFKTHNSNDSGTPEASLAWTACEPYWEDLEEKEYVLTQGEINSMINDGDVPVSIKVRTFNQNAHNVILENKTTDKYLKINGQFNNVISINTAVGSKEIAESQLYLNTLYKERGIAKCVYFDKLKEMIILSVYDGILYTKDLENYEHKSTGNINNKIMSEIIYIAELDKYICVGTDDSRTQGFIYSSNNGYDFDEVFNTNNVIFDVVYSTALQLIIAVGKGGLILTSSDGDNWITRQSNTSNDLLEIDCLEGVIMAVGYNKTIVTSSDGINWNVIENTPVGDYNFTAIKSGYECFYVGTSQGQLYKTVNGESFELLYTTFNLISEINFQDDVYIISYSGLGANRFGGIVYTKDFENFNEVTKINNASYVCSCYVPILGVYVGFGNTIIQFTLQEIISNTAYYDIRGNMSWDDELGFVVPCSAGRIVFVKDNKSSYKQFQTNNMSFTCSIVTNDKIIVMGQNICAIYNKSIKDWNFYSIPIYPNFAMYSNILKKFIAIATNRRIYISDDCINWEMLLDENVEKATEDEKSLYIIAYVINSQNRTIPVIKKTEDGINWEIVNDDIGIYGITDFVYVKYLKSFLLASTVDVKISNNECIHFTEILSTSTLNTRCIFSNEMIFILTDNKVYYSYNGYDYSILEELQLFYGGYSNREGFLFGQGNDYYKVISINPKNIIDKLSQDSDMNLNLTVGKNMVLLNTELGIITGNIRYRQKYIGV